MFKNKKKRILWIILIVIGAIGIMIGVYYLPPVHSRLAWRVAMVRGEIYYFFNPPDQEAFTPAQQAEMDAIVQQTLTAIAPVPTATLEPSSVAVESTPATESNSADRNALGCAHKAARPHAHPGSGSVDRCAA